MSIDKLIDAYSDIELARDIREYVTKYFECEKDDRSAAS